MIVIDIEATGPDVKTNSILSIGALDFNNPEYRFYGECCMRKGASVDSVGLKVSGFTLEQAKNNPQTDKELLFKLIQWASKIKDRTLAGQLIAWDKEVLENHFKRNGLPWIFSNGPENFSKTRVVDLHAASYSAHLKLGRDIPIDGHMSAVGLNTTLKFVGIDEVAKRRKAEGIHNAMEDAKLEAESFSRIIYGKKMFDEYKEYPIPKYLSQK